MRILHIITGLGPGGAEHMLWRLIAATPNVDHAVFSLSGPGVLSQSLSSAGAVMLNVEPERGRLRDLLSLRRRVAAWRPDALQGWMHHGNVAALLARSAAHKASLFWNIRQSITERRLTKPTTRAVIRVQAALSGRPDAIIYNAESAARDHEIMGFSRNKRVILPNGFDGTLFKPDLSARQRIRNELGLADEQPVVGLIARFDPWKNHEGFFRMAGRLLDRHPDTIFVLAGRDMEWANSALAAMIDDDLRDHVFLLGDRRDVPAINAALDIACNVSHGEGFPNAVGEAMACALPCMVTPVGASAELLGNCGLVARSPAPDDLHIAMDTLLGMSVSTRKALGDAARERILTHFSIEVVAQRYLDLYAQASSTHL